MSSQWQLNNKNHDWQGPRLRPLELQKFDGNLTNWLSFKDFVLATVIDNPMFQPVTKLQYLKQSLMGTAAQLFTNTAMVGDNFEKFWEALNIFFENERLLIDNAIYSLNNMRPINRESHQEIQHSYTTMIQHFRNLETLGRPVHNCDDFFVFIIVSKLDSESTKEWERFLGASNEPPPWIQLQQFLQIRMNTLLQLENSRNPKITSIKVPIKSHYAG